MDRFKNPWKKLRSKYRIKELLPKDFQNKFKILFFKISKKFEQRGAESPRSLENILEFFSENFLAKFLWRFWSKYFFHRFFKLIWPSVFLNLSLLGRVCGRGWRCFPMIPLKAPNHRDQIGQQPVIITHTNDSIPWVVWREREEEDDEFPQLGFC